MTTSVAHARARVLEDVRSTARCGAWHARCARGTPLAPPGENTAHTQRHPRGGSMTKVTKTKRKKSKGFTLIELLVVVA
ncbi:MAG: prepilin-type N-terminal cleavage/methylation domain-containing protein, partial [Deltaproteobacteria bacterium]